MPQVRKLPEELIRQIAAGEVVERPASVLKELLENALDAGARRVTISWEDAGRRSLRVADDGCGMAPADARLALERHATSKIAALEDLAAIGTFGFRGEALPSISAVSRFSLVTRPADAGEGWSISVEGGVLKREGPAGAPPGTTIQAEDLFFNVPARLKFLKSDATERGLLLRTVEDAAFAARGVDIRVFSEGKEVLDFRAAPGASPEEALKTRLACAWGEERARGLKPVRAQGRYMTVWGWLSDVHAHQPSNRFQRLYVNGRAVLHKRLTHALYDAYKGRLFVGRHPVACLFIEVNPALVDVNVHPAKREVRLSNEGEVHDFLSQALQAALTDGVRMPSAGGREGERSAPAVPPPLGFSAPRAPSWAESRAAYGVQAPASGSATQAALPALAAPAADTPWPLEAFRSAVFEPLAQFEDTYILARSAGQLYIFDQHAAAERALYERLKAGAEGRDPVRQALLIPWVWEVPPASAAVIQACLGHLTRLGYDLEPFGAGSFRVNGVPGVLGDSPKVTSLLESVVEDLLAEAAPRGWEDLLIRAACHGSVRAGEPLTPPLMARILKDLQSCQSPWSCPHGRPTFLKLEPGDLARRFKRT